MASLFIDIEEVTLTKPQGKALFEKLKAAVIAEHPNAEVTLNGDSEWDEEGSDEEAKG